MSAPKIILITAVRPAARFGELEIDGGQVVSFQEKPQLHEGWINGGFFVLEPGCLDLIEGDESWESGPLEKLAEAGELMAFRHDGFWQPMDNLHDKNTLENLWSRGKAPWKIW